MPSELLFLLKKTLVFMGNAESLTKIQESIPPHVTLVAVSKTKTEAQIMDLYHAGHRVFGESKVQELLPKVAGLPDDIQWHMVGHMQSNKVKYIAPFIALIHSVDSLKLLKVINKEGRKNDRIIDCLLQFHIAEEETKYGLNLEEAIDLLQSDAYKSMQHIRIRGVMGMATFTDDTIQVKREFQQLRSFFEQLREKFFASESSFSEISMGMSDDYPIAIEAGSTMVRIGSAIFGSRPPQ
jgi:PLP dependent protein